VAPACGGCSACLGCALTSPNGAQHATQARRHPHDRQNRTQWCSSARTVTFVRQLRPETCTGASGDVTGALFQLDPRGLGAASGAVALVQGSSCAFTSWDGYAADFLAKLAAVQAAGAAGLLYVDAVPDKPSGYVATAPLSLPACVLPQAAWAPLAALARLSDAGGSFTADFTALPLYRLEDEDPPANVITYFSVQRAPPRSAPAPTTASPAQPAAHAGTESTRFIITSIIV